MLNYQYNCISPRNIRELEHILDNTARQVSYQTFRNKVNKCHLDEIEPQLGYKKDFKMKDDGMVTYHRSKLLNGRVVYYFTHSAIEYIFY